MEIQNIPYYLINILNMGIKRQNLINLRYKVSEPRDLIENTEEIKFLEKQITIFHAKAVKHILEEFNVKLDLIGFHGQTLFHEI